MKKSILRKTTALLMAVIMLFTMAGCGKKEGKTEKTEKKDTKNMTYEGEELKIEGLKGEIGTLYVKADRVYFNTYEWDEEALKGEISEEDTSEETTSEEVTSEEDTSEETTSEEDTSEGATSEEDTSEETTSEEAEDEETDEVMEETVTTRFYSMKFDGTDLKELQLPKWKENEYMGNLEIDNAGNMVVYVTAYDMNTEKSSTSLCKVDAEGKELLREDITKALKLDTGDNYINKMLLDEKGRMVISVSGMTGATMYIFDENFKFVSEVKSDEFIDDIAKTKDGKIIGSGSSEEGNAFVQELDIDAKKWGKKYEVDVPYINGLLDGSEYDFYYRGDSGIFGYDLAAKKATEVLDYVASNITSDASWGIVPVSADMMIGTVYDDKGTSIILYKKVDPSTITDKKTITYGGVYIDDNIKKAAIEFNKKNQEYKIEFVDYSDAEDSVAKMNAEIAAGNIPDIIDLSMGVANMYVAKGMLEDLTPYLEKDSEISKEDLLPTVLEAMQVDGKLYWASPSFNISTLVGKTSEVGKNIGWTFEDMKALLDKKGDKTRLFFANYKTEMLYSFYYSFSDFVDWNTGECTFDSPEFKSILEFCNTGLDGEPNYEEYEENTANAYRNGEVLLQETWTSLEDFDTCKGLFGEDVTFIGYPDKDKSGSYFSFNQMVGISAKSEVKNEAWEFVRTLLTKKYQSTQYNVWGIPTRKDSYDMLVKAMTTTEEYTDELGQTVTPRNGMMGWDSIEIEQKPYKQADIDAFNELLNNTHKISSYDDKILTIIQDETKAYFAGTKNVDETVKVIQNRIKTYVNENR